MLVSIPFLGMFYAKVNDYKPDSRNPGRIRPTLLGRHEADLQPQMHCTASKAADEAPCLGAMCHELPYILDMILSSLICAYLRSSVVEYDANVRPGFLSAVTEHSLLMPCHPHLFPGTGNTPPYL